MKKIILSILLIQTMLSCSNSSKDTGIDSLLVDKAVAALSEKDGGNKSLIERGVKQVAGLWREQDGTGEEFVRFCTDNYYADPREKEQVFMKISNYLEAVYGHFNEMTLQLQRTVQEAGDTILPIDELFAAYQPDTHFGDDLYANKIAFVIALNFPEIPLKEKDLLGENRLAWAYARMGDLFTSRIPAEVLQACSEANANADFYISSYNIYAGHLLNKENKKIFPEDMILLSHWNLRDEIKANYNKGEEGLDKQQTIYEAMKRIISQEIPAEVINSGDYDWNPRTNTVYQGEKKLKGTPENTVRYEKFLNNFKTLQAMDVYTGNTYIERKFSQEMEILVEDADALFKEYLQAPELKKIGQMISDRLGRKLEAFDIWYDGFKPRSNLNEDKLSEQIGKLYPNAESMKKRLPDILTKLGFTPERAAYIADKVAVDAARGSGHAWGAAMKGQQSHLRTRIPSGGMDYKGYNIAVHEFGHNVEQTLSLYDVDYYMLNGVPNTAFTEALAFVFQKRDLDLLGIKNDDSAQEAADVLDKAWQMYEITGVALLDVTVWKWLYDHPQASPEQLKEAYIRLSKEIWNEYFAPVFGVKDETVLAVYSHSISYPLYLSAYSFGQIIEFQLEQHLAGKNFAHEVERIYRLGRLTPNQWMLQATGKTLSVEPILKAVQLIIDN